jgi:hypothetical protein
VWRAPFLPTIQTQLVTLSNPNGTLNNSALELTGILVGATLAATSHSTSYPHLVIASDNIPAVSWLNKDSTTSCNAPAFLLHRFTQRRHVNPFTVSAVFHQEPLPYLLIVVHVLFICQTVPSWTMLIMLFLCSLAGNLPSHHKSFYPT